jgi:hypothetical protein
MGRVKVAQFRALPMAHSLGTPMARCAALGSLS